MAISDDVKHALTECQALHANGKYQQAETLALWCIAQSQSIEDDLLLFRSYSALGHVLRASERFAEALNVLTTALTLSQTKLGPDEVAKAWNNLGVLFLGGCAWQLAIECFYKIIDNEVLRTTVDAHKAYGNAALSHLHCGNVVEGLTAIGHARRMAPANFRETEPFCFFFRLHTLVQLALRSGRVGASELVDAVAEVQRCDCLRADNRRIDLLCDLIEGGVAVSYGQDREAGIAALYRALQKAHFTPDLMVDVLSCLVQAELLAGRADQATAHLEAWIARTYEDAGWQAAEKLGLHSTARVSRVLQDRWPELPLGERKFTQRLGGGPPLPPGVVEGFLRWIGRDGEGMMWTTHHHDQTPLAMLPLLAEGLDRSQLAARLKLTEYSVKTMLPRLYRALGVDGREAAVALWHRLRTNPEAAHASYAGRLGWFYTRLLRHEFEDALSHWHNTPPRLRDSRARLVVALMLCLLKRDDHAAQEAALLLPTDAAVFVPFCEWWEGCEAAWPPLLARLREAPEGLRLPM
ncbi:MAG: transcriptional regulator, partial [Betaproteobacteria bacterium]|nr:transcriptional regulator [Betaproteobacteria bacterium]